MRFKEWLLIESKQVIINMGFPEIISKLLYERYGNIAPLIAKWYKEYRANQYRESPLWWKLVTWSSHEYPSLYELTYMYEATTDPETFRNAAEKMDVKVPQNIDHDYLEQQRRQLIPRIKDKFFEYLFFNYFSLMKDIDNKTLTDLSPYKRLPFMEAQYKYDRRNIFKNTQPLKVYPNGFKWIDVGKKSTLVGDQMGNCGSAGVMSMDPDRTILTLFGPNNKPHVMVTYSPGEKRISGDESAGSSPVKDKYHDYVIDLAQHLGARFDVNRSKSKLLGIKYLLHNKAQSVEPIEAKTAFSIYGEYFRIIIGGKTYYSDGYTVVTEDDVNKVQNMLKNGEITLNHNADNIVKTVLARANTGLLHSIGINYTPIQTFAAQTI